MFQHLPSFLIINRTKMPILYSMVRKTFEQVEQEVNQAANLLAQKVLALHDNTFGMVTFQQDEGSYIPASHNITLEIDVLPLLLHQKQYGEQKTKALLKPWIANIFAINQNPQALGFIRDNYGMCYLFNFIITETMSQNQIAIHKTQDKLSLKLPVKISAK